MVKDKPFHLTPAELCKRWGDRLSEGTLANWRSKKKGPVWMKIEGTILYPLDKIEEYEKKKTIQGTQNQS